MTWQHKRTQCSNSLQYFSTVHMRLLRTLDDRDPLRYIMDAAAEKEGFDPDVWIEQPFNTRLLQHACQLAERTRPRFCLRKRPAS
ncbi:uncharacterized protein LOC126094997 isoform X2 [Schistocerca cancellata]|uniref:uncharacterized protein LOC126094997 isoform X2 n=1 Tax=Schistocerca cancellata TaxID=274614 RepID=UPI00211931AC|nr:uncharacterized protein LOC126094997 isoform X2 [Schistocerca cancellata]